MREHRSQNSTRRCVTVGPDRSQMADRAAWWVPACATRSRAELFVGQVILLHHPATTEFGKAEHPRAAANHELTAFVRQCAEKHGHAFAVADEDSALAIARVTTSL